MLLNLTYEPIHKILQQYQTGFRKNRNFLELRKEMEAYYQSQLPLIALFIDFQKAFDSIDREMIWKILINYGVPEKTVSAVTAISSNSKSRVRLGESLIEAFQITTGFIQGAPLLPSYILLYWNTS